MSLVTVPEPASEPIVNDEPNDTTYSIANAAGTLTFGLDNSSTAFTGVVTNFVNTLPGTLTGMPLNLTKIGTGTTSFTGVSNAADIRRIAETGAAGCIVGRALYDGKVTLAEALSSAGDNA